MERIIKYCKYCGKELTSEQRHNTYCSQACANAGKRQDKINAWLNGTFDGSRGDGVLSQTIRDFLLEQANYQCEKCGWSEINPTTGKVPLEIHHIDGDYENNQPENLQVLCPNCHSLTENFKARGNGRADRKKYYMTNTCIDCGKVIANTSIRCCECEGKRRRQIAINNLPISREELKQKIRLEPFEAIGREYNVSGNTIKKWCDKYNLPRLKKDINNISDKDWENI